MARQKVRRFRKKPVVFYIGDTCLASVTNPEMWDSELDINVVVVGLGNDNYYRVLVMEDGYLKGQTISILKSKLKAKEMAAPKSSITVREGMTKKWVFGEEIKLVEVIRYKPDQWPYIKGLAGVRVLPSGEETGVLIEQLQ